MASTTTTLILAFSMPLIGFSQNNNIANTGNRSTQNKARTAQSVQYKPVQEPDIAVLELVSSNAVSKTITVHTYKYLAQNNSTVQNTDSQPIKNNSSETNSIIESFLKLDGVMRCTFDHTTRTFTILSGPLTDLSAVTNSINKK